MRDEGTAGLAGEFLPGDPEAVEAHRLAEVLARVEAGHAPDVDPTEDPALASLLSIATRARAEMGTLSDERAFHSFHARSRAAILHSLERPAQVVPFRRRASIAAPFAAVAAAAAIVIGVFSPALRPGHIEQIDI